MSGGSQDELLKTQVYGKEILASVLFEAATDDSFFFPVDGGLTGFAYDGRAYQNGAEVPEGAQASWFTEPSGPFRGDRAEFPQRGLVVVTDAGLSVIDLESRYAMWLVALRGDTFGLTDNFLGNISGFIPAGVSYQNGRILIQMNPDQGSAYTAPVFIVFDFVLDNIYMDRPAYQPPVVGPYSTDPAIYMATTEITPNVPAVDLVNGGKPTLWWPYPALPAGFLFDTETGTISGRPVDASDQLVYQIAALNPGGMGMTTVTIQVEPFNQITVSISPLSPTADPGGSVSFSALVTGGSVGTVTWAASGGTIDEVGNWTAPATPGTYQITATSVEDPSVVTSTTATVAAAAVYAQSAYMGVDTGSYTTYTIHSAQDANALWALSGANQGFAWRMDTTTWVIQDLWTPSGLSVTGSGDVQGMTIMNGKLYISIWDGASSSIGVYEVDPANPTAVELCTARQLNQGLDATVLKQTDPFWVWTDPVANAIRGAWRDTSDTVTYIMSYLLDTQQFVYRATPDAITQDSLGATYTQATSYPTGGMFNSFPYPANGRPAPLAWRQSPTADPEGRGYNAKIPERMLLYMVDGEDAPRAISIPALYTDLDPMASYGDDIRELRLSLYVDPTGAATVYQIINHTLYDAGSQQYLDNLEIRKNNSILLRIPPSASFPNSMDATMEVFHISDTELYLVGAPLSMLDPTYTGVFDSSWTVAHIVAPSNGDGAWVAILLTNNDPTTGLFASNTLYAGLPLLAPSGPMADTSLLQRATWDATSGVFGFVGNYPYTGIQG